MLDNNNKTNFFLKLLLSLRVRTLSRRIINIISTDVIIILIYGRKGLQLRIRWLVFSFAHYNILPTILTTLLLYRGEAKTKYFLGKYSSFL